MKAMANQFACQREIGIDAGHRVPDHGSKCFNVHGHRYKILATMVGATLEGEQTGMVMDFSFLKECMMNAIDAPYDHAMIWYEKDPLYFAITNSDAGRLQQGWKNAIVDCVPTAENLAKVWFYALKNEIDIWFLAHDPEAEVPELTEIRVWETPNCCAWYPATQAIKVTLDPSSIQEINDTVAAAITGKKGKKR